MSVTITDVARRAGVGRGTVSRVLNDHPSVDPATRERVRAVIDELGFVPSSAGRRLSSGRSGAVAVLVVLDDAPRTLAVLRGVAGVLGTAGLDLVLFDVASPARRAAVLADLLVPGRVDGVVVAGLTLTDDEAARLVAADAAAVVVDGVHPSFPSVGANPSPDAAASAERAAGIGAARLVREIADRARTRRGEPVDDDEDERREEDPAAS